MLETILVTVVALVSAIGGWLLSHRWEKRKYQLAIDAELNDWNRDLRAWGTDVVSEMVPLHDYFERESKEKAVDKSGETSVWLTALVD